MENLYSRLLELLGKRYNDEKFIQFLSDIGESPDSEGRLQDQPFLTATSFTFYKGGFILYLVHGQVVRIYAIIDLMATREGVFTPFQSLPAGITKDDQPPDIDKKLDLKPFSSKPGGYYAYYLDPYVLKFDFEDGHLTTFEIQWRP